MVKRKLRKALAKKEFGHREASAGPKTSVSLDRDDVMEDGGAVYLKNLVSDAKCSYFHSKD